MEQFYVTKETTCARCNGSKVVQDGLWRDYWADVNNGKIAPDKQTMYDYFANCGCDIRYEALPPEEYTCPDCDGEGVTIRKIELSEALKSINFESLAARVEWLERESEEKKAEENLDFSVKLWNTPK